MDNTWDNFKTHFTEVYFELKEDNELIKNHVRFVVYETKYQSHVEEAHMYDTLINLANVVK